MGPVGEQTARPHYQRARRDAEKTERRQAILSSADALLREVGFDAFSMNVLAQKTGMAKGTLYLYFETREEVLLTLYVERLRTWGRVLSKGLDEGLTDRAFVDHFLATSLADPTFLALRARLESVMEQNVSRERLFESKRVMRDVIASLAPQLELCLNLESGDGTRVLFALATLMLGASQMDPSPALDGVELPADLADLATFFSSSELFRAYAPMLLAGIRGERAAGPGA